MASANQYPGIDPQIAACVRHHSRRMAGRIPGMDIEDLEQAMMLHVHRRRPAYDPRLARLRTFVDRILRNFCAQLIEAAGAIRRNPDTPSSAMRCPCRSAPDGDHDLQPEHANNGAADLEDEWCERVHLRCDVDRAVATLPEHLAECCRWLAIGSTTEAARRAGLARGSIHSRVVTIRRQFIAAGLDAYVAVPARQFGERPGM